MPKQVTKTVYTFAELSEDAKEKAPESRPLREIAAGLWLHGEPIARAIDDSYKLWDGGIYRGYAHNSWSNRKGEQRWLVHAWSGDQTRKFQRGTYKTREGAIRALIAKGREFAEVTSERQAELKASGCSVTHLYDSDPIRPKIRAWGALDTPTSRLANPAGLWSEYPSAAAAWAALDAAKREA